MSREPGDWHVATNLNNTPDAQGTLFSGGKRYSSDKRYPKGFTPERRDAVSQALVPKSGVYLGRNGMERHSQTFSGNRNLRDFQFGDDKQHTRSKQGLRRAVENIARSTVPLEHLQPAKGFKEVRLTVDESHYDGQLAAKGNAGEYWHAGMPQGGVPSGRNDIVVQTDYADSPTVIHEVGHHASNVQMKPHSGAWGGYRTPGTRGLEEGFADKYADEHYRDPKGNPAPRQGTYAGGIRDETRTDGFYKQYHKVRGTEYEAQADNPINTHVASLRNTGDEHIQREEAENKHSLFTKRTAQGDTTSAAYMEVNRAALPRGTSKEDVMPGGGQRDRLSLRMQAKRAMAPKVGDLQGDPSRAKMKP